MRLRLVEPVDCHAVVDLIDSVLKEYGDTICLGGADRDLNGICDHYDRLGGAFVVLDDGGRIRGTHAVVPVKNRPRVCNLRRLYLDAGLRGGEWGTSLMDWALDWGRVNGFDRCELWSDTRFARAHSFFRRFGFQRDGRSRDMNDGSMPYSEYFFFLAL